MPISSISSVTTRLPLAVAARQSLSATDVTPARQAASTRPTSIVTSPQSTRPVFQAAETAAPNALTLDPFRPDLDVTAGFRTEVRDAIRGNDETIVRRGEAEAARAEVIARRDELQRRLFQLVTQEVLDRSVPEPPERLATSVRQASARTLPDAVPEPEQPTDRSDVGFSPRVFERAAIIPVGYFVPAPVTAPLSTRLDAEPVIASREFPRTGRRDLPPTEVRSNRGRAAEARDVRADRPFTGSANLPNTVAIASASNLATLTRRPPQRPRDLQASFEQPATPVPPRVDRRA